MTDDIEPGAAPTPSRDEFLALLGVPDAKAPALLRVLLERVRPGATPDELAVAFEHLGRFIVAGPAIATRGPSAHARLALVVLALERVPAARARVTAGLARWLGATSAIRLLAEVGLPNDRGLWAETTDRLASRLLPPPPDARDLAAVTARIVRVHHDHAWLGPADEPLLARLALVLGDIWAPLRTDAVDAIGLLRAREVPRDEQRTLARAVLGRFVRRPVEFFWPPREPRGARPATGSPHGP